jgi:hypothetical protein
LQRVSTGESRVRFDLDPFQLELAWVGISNHGAAYLVTGNGSPNGVVASLSLSF